LAAVPPSNQGTVNAAPTAEVAVTSETPAVAKPSPASVASNNSSNQELPKNTLGESKSALKIKPTPANSIPQIEPLFAAASFSFNPAEGIVSLFILILILDMIIIERRKIVRFVGHNIDHIFYLSLILVVIFVLAKGLII
jgi:hypothetical protein